MSLEGCAHYTTVRIKLRKEPDDPIAIPHICLKCGKAFLMYPIKFKNNPEAKKQLEELAKHVTENIPGL